MVITRKLIFISLLIPSMSALADANDGEHLGFKLGSKFVASEAAIARNHITGALVYHVDPHKRHRHIDSLSVYVSPNSSIIGSVFGGWYFSSKRSAEHFSDRYLESLETTYSNWKRSRNTLTNGDYQIWVDLEQRPPIVDHWPSNRNFRVSVAMIFTPESTARSVWMARVMREAKTRD